MGTQDKSLLWMIFISTTVGTLCLLAGYWIAAALNFAAVAFNAWVLLRRRPV